MSQGQSFPYSGPIPEPSPYSKRLECNTQWASLVATRNGISQLHGHATQDPLSLSEAAPASDLPTLRLSHTSRESWERARTQGSTSTPEVLPPSVRRGYRLSSEDWAFLGAVRCPDDPLTASLPNTVGDEPNEWSLPGPKRLRQLAECLHDQVQFTAQAMRPLSHAIQGMFCIPQLIAELQTAVLRGQASRTNQVNRELSGVNTFVWSALEDLADSMGRFNSNAVRHLRGLWLDKSSLPTETREELCQRPITRGRVPADRNSVYTAPLIGGFIPDLYVPHPREPSEGRRTGPAVSGRTLHKSQTRPPTGVTQAKRSKAERSKREDTHLPPQGVTTQVSNQSRSGQPAAQLPGHFSGPRPDSLAHRDRD